jgi:hypothetical protein
MLGKNEQALVIADIDPVNSAEGRPRPQLLPSPLRLVAHLPLIEAWKQRSKSTPNAPCRCGRSKPLAIHEFGWLSELAGVGKEISKLNARNTAVVASETVAKLHKVLKDLAKSQLHSKWLDHRADAFAKEHAANPQPLLPPAAYDWIWVDLDHEADPFPTIEVPPYSKVK